MDPTLKIVIVDESPIRAAILEDRLREAGFIQVIGIDLENPSRDVLERMFHSPR